MSAQGTGDGVREDNIVYKMEKNDGSVSILSEALNAEAYEHDMTMWQAVKAYPKAVLWSMVVSLCIVMEAYDNSLIGNFYALPAFRERYGVFVNEAAGYQIPASWQTGLSLAANIGAFFGIFITGPVADRIGYRKVSLLATAWLAGAIFLTFFANGLAMLFIGEFLIGLSFGAYINVAPAYASEVAPIALRTLVTQYVQICWVIGQFVSSGILYKMNQRTDQWAYRIPFAIQWAWMIPLVPLLLLAPDSPWWLARKGRLADAEKAVRRLGGTTTLKPSDTVAMMVRTINIEKEQTEGASFWDCFRGADLRRTLIGCAMFAFQNFSGLLLGNQATYFFQQAGLPSDQAFSLSLGNTAIQFVTVCFCWVLSARFGRRQIYLGGLGFNLVFLLLTGIVASVPSSSAATWVQAVFIILTYAMYGLTIGPVTYTIIAETSSIRLRAKSVGLARAAYYLVVFPTYIINNYMLNPSAWNLAGKSGYVWFGTALACWVSAYFFLPECKGRSYRELDILFKRRVPARNFASTVINARDEQ